jgi:outer membrane protein
MRFLILCFWILATFNNQLSAQQAGILTLQDALRLAEKNYPSIKAGIYNVDFYQSNVKVQKFEWLPRLDINMQAVTSTLNNIYGLYYPQDIALSISGPVKTDNTYQPVWGSTLGLLVSWQPLTFGERKAKIELANSELTIASNELANEIFNHDLVLIDTWLNYLAANAISKAAYTNLVRTRVLLQSIEVLAAKGLKPGVDSFIAEGQVSKAKMELNNANQSSATYKLKIAEELGLTDTAFSITIQNFLSHSPVLKFTSIDSVVKNPSLVLFESQIEEANAKLLLARHSYHPRINLYESSFARGSGANISGVNDYSLTGLSFSKYNYAIGLSLTFPILQYFPVKSQIRMQQSTIMKQKELYDEQEIKLKDEEKTAIVHFETALQNYNESQIRYRAATGSYNQMNVRYASGLTTLPELFEIQYELQRAEAENSISILTVWKAYLDFTQASGNINLFTDQLK